MADELTLILTELRRRFEALYGERKVQTSESLNQIAMIRLMVRRLTS
jgi:hypothetical protein